MFLHWEANNKTLLGTQYVQYAKLCYTVKMSFIFHRMGHRNRENEGLLLNIKCTVDTGRCYHSQIYVQHKNSKFNPDPRSCLKTIFSEQRFGSV